MDAAMRMKLQECDREARKATLEKKRKRLKKADVELDWTDQKEVDALAFQIAIKKGLRSYPNQRPTIF